MVHSELGPSDRAVRLCRYQVQMSASDAERKCWHRSLPAAIGVNAENICSR